LSLNASLLRRLSEGFSNAAGLAGLALMIMSTGPEPILVGPMATSRAPVRLTACTKRAYQQRQRETDKSAMQRALHG